jgi:hypothetical protein
MIGPFSINALLGICFFIMGIVACSSYNYAEERYQYRMRKLLQREFYGRRKSDANATRKFNLSGEGVVLLGFSLSIIGIFLFASYFVS